MSAIGESLPEGVREIELVQEFAVRCSDGFRAALGNSRYLRDPREADWYEPGREEEIQRAAMREMLYSIGRTLRGLGNERLSNAIKDVIDHSSTLLQRVGYPIQPVEFRRLPSTAEALAETLKGQSPRVVSTRIGCCLLRLNELTLELRHELAKVFSEPLFSRDEGSHERSLIEQLRYAEECRDALDAGLTAGEIELSECTPIGMSKTEAGMTVANRFAEWAPFIEELPTTLQLEPEFSSLKLAVCADATLVGSATSLSESTRNADCRDQPKPAASVPMGHSEKNGPDPDGFEGLSPGFGSWGGWPGPQIPFVQEFCKVDRPEAQRIVRSLRRYTYLVPGWDKVGQ